MRNVVLVVLVSAAAGAAAAEPVRFCVTADNKAYKGLADVLKVMKEIPGGPGRFMISAGDFSPPEMTRRRLDDAFGPSFLWYPVIGNHEAGTKVDSHPGEKDSNGAHPADEAAPRGRMEYLRYYFEKHLKDKVNPGPDGCRETTWSFDVGEVHVVAINEYWNGKTKPGSDAATTGDVPPALRDWLRKDLAASKKPWKLVVGHEPAFPQTDQDWKGARHSGSSLNANKENRDAFWKLLEEQRVAAYICGHTHRYSRYRPEGSSVWQIDAAQARNSSTSWKYDTFLIITADRKALRFDVYRNLEKRGKFRLTDELVLEAPVPKGSPK